MAVYTAYDMIEDCRADRAQGWRYFVAHYAPAARIILRHYCPERDIIETVAGIARPDSPLFASAISEREFMAALRLEVLAGAPDRGEAIAPEDFARALEPLAAIEKQAVWLGVMRYDAAAAGAMISMQPDSVERVRARAEELLGAGLASIARPAAGTGSEQCPPARTLLEFIDGRLTWTARDDLERRLADCWHCVDHLCRYREACEILRELKALSEKESEPFLRAIGIEKGRRPLWKRLIAGA